MKSIDKLREAATYNPAFSDNATRIVCNYLSEIEAEIADNYMLLPVDADGVPWHIGEEVDGCEIVAMAGYQLYYYDDDSKTIEWCIAKNRRHVKPDPLKELLDDVSKGINCYPRERITGYLDWNTTTAEAVMLDVRDRLRELLGGDAE